MEKREIKTKRNENKRHKITILTVVIFAIASILPASAAAREPKLRYAYGITADGDNVYVADTGQHRIRIYDNNLNFKENFAFKRDGERQFTHPYGIAVDPAGGLFYVADAGNNKVKVFKKPYYRSGDYLYEISEAYGKGLLQPRDVKLDKHGNLYILDAGNARILKVFADNGDVWSYGAEDGIVLSDPHGLDVDEDGEYIYVTDTFKNRILRIDARTGVYIETGKKGSGPGEFMFPQAVTLNGSNIYVSDTDNHRIQIFEIIWDADSSTDVFSYKGTVSDFPFIKETEKNDFLRAPQKIYFKDDNTIIFADSGVPGKDSCRCPRELKLANITDVNVFSNIIFYDQNDTVRNSAAINYNIGSSNGGDKIEIHRGNRLIYEMNSSNAADNIWNGHITEDDGSDGGLAGTGEYSFIIRPGGSDEYYESSSLRGENIKIAEEAYPVPIKVNVADGAVVFGNVHITINADTDYFTNIKIAITRLDTGAIVSYRNEYDETKNLVHEWDTAGLNDGIYKLTATAIHRVEYYNRNLEFLLLVDNGGIASAWKEAFGSDYRDANGNLIRWDGDQDGDGYINFLEFFMGSDMYDPDSYVIYDYPDINDVDLEDGYKDDPFSITNYFCVDRRAYRFNPFGMIWSGCRIEFFADDRIQTGVKEHKEFIADAGADVTFRVLPDPDSYIRLNKGFKAKKGSRFHAVRGYPE